MKNYETCKAIDFDRLDMLVSERIGILKIYVQSMTREPLNEAICRDLVFPCIANLMQFIDSMRFGEEAEDDQHQR